MTPSAATRASPTVRVGAPAKEGTVEGARSLDDLVHLLIQKLLHNDEGAEQFLLPLEDGRIIDTKGWAGWEWTHGVALYGLWEHHQLTGSKQSLKVIEEWFSDRMKEGGTTKNINTMAPFLALACIVERYPEHQRREEYISWIDEWAEWAMNELERTEEGGLQHVTYIAKHDQQLWDDTLFMTVLPLAKIGLVLGRREYVDEALYQFLLHIRYLSDTQTGLWFHGWCFDGRHNFARASWARGNCWITLAIPILIDMLESHKGHQLHSVSGPCTAGGKNGISDLPSSVRRELVAALEAQVKALTRVQDPASGLFHTLLDDPSSYLESSATAGFAAGTLLALRKGLLSDEKYTRMAEAAVKATMEMIAPDGELKQTSFGTAMGNDLDFYRKIPITPMPYGQALALLAIVQRMAKH